MLKSDLLERSLQYFLSPLALATHLITGKTTHCYNVIKLLVLKNIYLKMHDRLQCKLQYVMNLLILIL